jgi:hypothetical protein
MEICGGMGIKLYALVILAVLFGSNGNSYRVYAVRYVYMYAYSSQYTDSGRAK